MLNQHNRSPGQSGERKHLMNYETTLNLFGQPVTTLVEYERDGSGVEGILIHDICLVEKIEHLNTKENAPYSFGIRRKSIFEFIESEAIAALAMDIDKQEINQKIKAEQDTWEEIMGGNKDCWLKIMDRLYQPARNPWR
jgi:hypothetical protein